MNATGLWTVDLVRCARYFTCMVSCLSGLILVNASFLFVLMIFPSHEQIPLLDLSL